MSPLGKSGQYYMNPHEMQRKGDMPGAPKTDPAAQMDSDQANEGDQGDGMRHHQIDETPEGGAHSVRTNGDGTTEEMDHDSFEDACASCGGEDNEGDDEGQGESEVAASDMGGTDDMAGMYDKSAKG